MPHWLKWGLAVALCLGVVAITAVLVAGWLIWQRMDWGSQPHVRLLLRVDVDAATPADRDAAVEQTIAVIKRRLAALQIRGDVVREAPGSDRIVVRHSGLKDAAEIRRKLLLSTRMELTLVRSERLESRQAALAQYRGELPPDLEVAVAVNKREQKEGVYVIDRMPVVTARDIEEAVPSRDAFGQPSVSFNLRAAGARRLRDVTQQNIGRPLAIIIDGHVMSAPVIRAPISDYGEITGNFTEAEVRDLALALASGELPAPVAVLEERIAHGEGG